MKLLGNGILTALVSILTILGFAFASYFYVESTYAKGEEVQKIEQRLEYKIKSDQGKEIQQRLWLLEDRYEKKPMAETIKEEYRKLQEEKKSIDNDLNQLRKK